MSYFIRYSITLFCLLFSHVLFAQVCESNYANLPFWYVSITPGAQGGVSCYYHSDKTQQTDNTVKMGNYIPVSGPWWYGSLGFPFSSSYNCGINEGDVHGPNPRSTDSADSCAFDELKTSREVVA